MKLLTAWWKIGKLIFHLGVSSVTEGWQRSVPCHISILRPNRTTADMSTVRKGAKLSLTKTFYILSFRCHHNRNTLQKF